MTDPFINFPDEMIIRICDELDTSSLLNMAEASSKVYQVCSDIIKEKQKLYFKEKEFQREVDNILSDLDRNKVVFYENKFKSPYDVVSTVTLMGVKPNPYSIQVDNTISFNVHDEDLQNVKEKVSKTVPSIIPVKTGDDHLHERYHLPQGYAFTRKYTVDKNRDSIEQLIRTLHQQGYSFSGSEIVVTSW